MTISRVIVLDPGKTTGLVDWDNTSENYPTFDAHELNFDDTCKFLMEVARSGNLYGDTVIVSESFIITQQTAKNSQAPWSLELIGVARMVSKLYLQRDLVLQQPSAAKRFSSDQRLKMMSFWTPAKGHANDAARHLLLFMATRKLLTQEQLSAFAEMA